MTGFAAARRMMVDCQVRTADVTDLRLTEAMFEVPRERFLPERSTALAYLDLDIPVNEAGEGVRRYLLKPMVLAKLLQMAEITETDRVLDVGCASGYSSALIAHLAGSVTALEEDPALAQRAGATLTSLAFANVQVVRGPLAQGWASGAPYDAIVIEGAVETVPDALFHHLTEGGRLVCVAGREPARKAMLYRSVNGEISGRSIFEASAPALPGFAQPPAFAF